MRVSRLFVSQSLKVGDHIELDDDAAHYLRSVLRLKPQQTIIVFNGSGGEYSGQLSEVSRKTVRIAIEQFFDRDVESSLTINLGLGISRGDRMDWAVQKAVELGATELTPLMTERCVIKFDADKKQQRLQHWRHIVQHATEQSGRTRLPTLQPIITIGDWLASQSGLRIFLDPYAAASLADLQPQDGRVTLLTGPEGGFSEAERQQARQIGFIPVRLGARILRTETAALSALTAVQTLWGDFC